MASNITYNGVSGAEGGGNIFRDVRFWVALRVPMRATILKMITENQGSVVPLEKNADICIADHARKDAPPGSYSWKFITDSVDKGIIQLQDRYRIGPDPDMPRPAGAGVHAKGTRVPYTKADDAALAAWMLSHLADHSGNKIFQEFEHINPRHPWQSWRNRWLKTLSLLPKRELKRLAATATAPENEDSDNATEHPTNQDSNGVSAASGSGAQERQATNENTSDSQPGTRNGNSHPRIGDDTREVSQDREFSAEGNIPEEDSVPESRSLSGEIPAEDDAADRIADNSTLSRPDSISREDAALEDDAAAEGTNTFMPRDQFYSDLHDYMLANDLEIEIQHHIGGRDLELWDLLEAANAQNVPLEELNWKKVAEDLGYDWVRQKPVVRALQNCFEDNLAEFVVAIASFYTDDEEEIDEVAHAEVESEAVASVSHEEELSPPGYVPSSPPIGLAAKKRSLDMQPSSSEYSSKRRRFDRDMIIPSTPDERIGVIRHHLFSQTPSPSLRKSMMRNKNGGANNLQELPPIRQTAGERLSNVSTPRDRDDQFTTPHQPRVRVEPTDSQYDVTPSQQLRSESELHSPIPVRLRSRSTSRNAPSSNNTPRQTAQRAESVQEISRTLSNHGKVAEAGPSTQPPARKRTLPASFRPSQASGPSQRSSQPQRQKQKPPIQHGKDRVGNEENRRQIDLCIEYYKSLGFSHEIVVESLRRTNMTPEVAQVVMESLQAGHGVPDRHEFIWTDRDDASLRLVDSVDTGVEPLDAEEAQWLKKAKREWNRLVRKHGLEGVELRRKFLEDSAIADNEAPRR